LLSAFVHASIELAFLILESSSAKTSFMHYTIVCFNGRFGWVPFVNLFTSSAPLSEKNKEVIDFDKIEK